MLGYFGKSFFALCAAAALMLSGGAFAATYNIILKGAESLANIGCAAGGFTFTKTTAGTFPTSGASLTTQPNCIRSPAIANGTYTPGNLNVVVQNITTPQPQGPNTEGLTGTLQFATTAPGDCRGTGTSTAQKTYTITFSYGGSPNPALRTFTLTCSGPGSLGPFNGRYDVRNTAAAPEPETLLLMLAGLGGYILVMRRRRHIGS